MSSKKNSSKKISSDEKSKAAAAFWDFLFLFEKLELFGTDKHNDPKSGPQVYDGVGYIQKHGKSDGELH